ncbi:hypothetical protein JL108_12285 [Aeromicrobium sp. YIM 150415]|uniref:hypothetical protein n=1 Tax=Aeromicrobium sp. YIM 150415 TaxID=2803912 RepID=UPI0019657E3E|nr:hypothetical protein [Aeromicrobium sp. YIM 150415]MBM9464230.1 hypothetical protein [Aeromicrobium sp. YIM 150415]
MSGHYPPPDDPGAERPGDQPPEPPPGGYPPPPGGGYPPHDPAAGYPRPSGSYEVGAAFSWAWERFKQNLGPLVISVLIITAISGAISGATTLPTLGQDSSTMTTGDALRFSAATGVWNIVGGLLTAIIVAPLSLNLVRMFLAIADGHRADIGDLFKTDLIGPAILLGLLTWVLTMVGLVLCIIPGLIFVFGAAYATYMMADRGLSPWESIKASFGVYQTNFGMALVGVLLGGIIAGVGVIACFIGVLFTAPIGGLFITYAFRRLTGGVVAG